MQEFSFSTRIFFGENALERLRKVKNRNVLIVTDAFMAKTGVADKVADYLTDCNVTIFDGVVPDPPIEVVTEGVKAMQAANAQVMIAVGGGSSIDAAKAIRAVGNNIPELGTQIMECFAIPTTSGTGSEVTEYAVISDKAKGIKYPLDSKALRPPTAILDPSLVVSAPSTVTADTGMDVLTHALEAYVSTGYNDFSDAMAEKAITLVFRFLGDAYSNGKDLLAREKMHNASCMAGLAFNSAGLGLNHGIAHALGAKFHIPHGRANAIVLPHVIRYNAQLDRNRLGKQDDYTVTAKKYQRCARILDLPAANVQIGVNNLIREIEKLAKDMGVPMSLRDAGVEQKAYEAQRPALIEAALNDATVATNPVKPSADDVGKILDKLSGYAK